MEETKLILEYIRVLAWPIVALLISLLFRRQIGNLVSRVQKADLPGGISFQLKEGKELSTEVKEEERPFKEKERGPVIPLTEANTRMLNLGLAPSPSGLQLSNYRVLAEQDPNLALAGLRIETETMLKNLAKGSNVAINKRDSAAIIARRLREQDKITSRQFELIGVIIRLCNAAIHGYKLTKDQADTLLDIATVLRDQYISWLSWGFSDNWKPSK